MAHSKRSEKGLALIVVLLFTVAITTVVVIGVQRSLSDEGSSRNQLDSEAARLAAESALRDAERDLGGAVLNASARSCQRPAPDVTWPFASACPQGLCRKDVQEQYAETDWTAASATNTTVSEFWWPASKGGVWNDDLTEKPSRTPPDTGGSKCGFEGGVPYGTFTGAEAIPGVVRQPEYVIEHFIKPRAGQQEAEVYRITARGFGYTRRTQVVLQTVFVPDEAH